MFQIDIFLINVFLLLYGEILLLCRGIYFGLHHSYVAKPLNSSELTFWSVLFKKISSKCFNWIIILWPYACIMQEIISAKYKTWPRLSRKCLISRREISTNVTEVWSSWAYPTTEKYVYTSLPHPLFLSNNKEMQGIVQGISWSNR